MGLLVVASSSDDDFGSDRLDQVKSKQTFWVLSFPFPLRLLFSIRPFVMGKVLGIVYRTIALGPQQGRKVFYIPDFASIFQT